MSLPFKAIAGGVLGLAILFTGMSSYTQVQQGEVAFVRRMGSADPTKMLHDGPQFVAPFISTVDRLNVTQRTAHLDPFQVKTVDNQNIGIKMNVTYKIPEASAYYVLYGLGTPGDNDISDNIAPIVMDRARRVLNTRNTTQIAGQSEEIQSEMLHVIHEELTRLFKVDIVSVQIENYIYSPAFEESNNRAVLAKNEALLQENNKRVIEYQAAQKVIAAKGEADQAIEAARGKASSAKLAADGQAYTKLTITKADSEALVIQAEADKTASELRGKGEASALKAMVDAAGGPSAFVAKLNAEAAKNWKGEVPGIVTSEKAGAMMPLVMPTQNAPK